MRAGRAQIVFLLLLLVAVAQVLWWIYDQARYSRERQRELLATYESERAAAEELFVAGEVSAARWAEQLAPRFPHLELVDGSVRIRPEAIEALERERLSHVNQYGWEGAFFLVVLGAGIWVIRRALLRERELRLRQENFLAAVSHELKSPIASLRMAGETMQRHDLSADRAAALVQRNLRDLDRLEELISKLLDTSRIEARRVALQREPIVLAQAVERIVSELTDEAVGVVRVDVPADLQLSADRVAFDTIVRNLLANALVAVGDVDCPEIVVEAGRRDRRIDLLVRDNGVGFEPAEAERLFEKFYRTGDELTRRSKGTGLGLYLVRRFAELEGATVVAQSPGVGRGATFTVGFQARRS